MLFKKFPAYTKSGLGITKSGRLMVPLKCQITKYSGDNSVNDYGQPHTAARDYIVDSYTSMITKNTIRPIDDMRNFNYYLSEDQIAELIERNLITIKD